MLFPFSPSVSLLRALSFIQLALMRFLSKQTEANVLIKSDHNLQSKQKYKFKSNEKFSFSIKFLWLHIFSLFALKTKVFFAVLFSLCAFFRTKKTCTEAPHKK